MNDTATHIEIDERWIGEWVDYGLTEIRVYLHKHDRFEAYCNQRDLQAQLPTSLRSAHAGAGR